MAIIAFLLAFVKKGAERSYFQARACMQWAPAAARAERTSDSIEKAVGFYKKEAGLEFTGESKEGAMFKKGNVDVPVQNPWMNMKTG